jgi:threonine/homoserine/homoserine lactone efflux protein
MTARKIGGMYMSLENYGLFLMTSFLLWITPGQDTLYIIARSISQGRFAGIVSALGIGTGGLVHAALAIAGISVIILTSPTLFMLVKISGGLYLIYLGISALLSNQESTMVGAIEDVALMKIYAQGVVTNILNPKVALFFIAFLPQFISSSGSTASLMVLGVTFVIGGTIWCLIVAYFASSFSLILSQHNSVKKWFSNLSGAVYIGLGVNILRAKV